MRDLDEHGRLCEETFGLISGMYLHMLWELSTAAGSMWNYADPSTMEIIVTKGNADQVYGLCKEIRSNGYSIGLNSSGMKKVKKARQEAHAFLYEEANDPATTIERKIELVKLTGKNNY